MTELILQHLPETDFSNNALQVVQVPSGEHLLQLISVQQNKPSELRTLGSITVEVHTEHLVALSAIIQSEHFEAVFRQQAVPVGFANPVEQCKHLLSPLH